MKLFTATVLILCLLLVQTSAFAGEKKPGRTVEVYINKVQDPVRGELIYAKDSVLIVAKTLGLKEKYIYDGKTKLDLILARNVRHVKLLKIEADFSWKLAFAGLGVGVAVDVLRATTQKNKTLTIGSFVTGPIGMVVGFFAGLIASKWTAEPEEIYIPEPGKPLNELAESSRFGDKPGAKFIKLKDSLLTKATLK